MFTILSGSALATIALPMLETHPALPVVGVAKVEHGRVGAERLAAAPAWIQWQVGREELSSEPTMLGAIATLESGATGSLPPGLAGGAPAGLLTTRSGWHQRASGAGRITVGWAAADPGRHQRISMGMVHCLSQVRHQRATSSPLTSRMGSISR